MHSQPLTFLRLLAIAGILAAATVAWFVLAAALMHRTTVADAALGGAVESVWGDRVLQRQPEGWINSPAAERGRRTLLPARSDLSVRLDYEPRSKGLLWYRTFRVRFDGRYVFENPTPVAQTVYVQFLLPQGGSELEGVAFQIGETSVRSAPRNGVLTEAATVPAGGSLPVRVTYQTRGRDEWRYDFAAATRVRDVHLHLTTNFAEIDFPAGGSAPTSRARNPEGGWTLDWNWSDIIGPKPVAMAMPNVLNAGPVAARISLFAPVSLVFFFAFLLIVGAARGLNLHPMNYVFLAAGCFAFQLLFAYLVDLVPVHASFAIAAIVSLLLTGGYVHLVGGRRLSRLALPAQFAYMVLFSYSFFFEGISGLVITIGAIVTLAILMVISARVDWNERFRPRRGNPVAV